MAPPPPPQPRCAPPQHGCVPPSPTRVCPPAFNPGLPPSLREKARIGSIGVAGSGLPHELRIGASSLVIRTCGAFYEYYYFYYC